MSYEGSVEFLCQNGHRSVIGCWDDAPKACRCGARMAYRHAIDHTNGYIEDDPNTQPAPVEPDGWDDVWKEDHYGNRYAIKNPRFKPLSGWRDLVSVG